MINKPILSKTILPEKNYRSITYEYDSNLYISVSLAEDHLGEFKGLTIGKNNGRKTIQVIPHHITAGLLDEGDKKIELTITFETPIFLDEKTQIDKLFQYYQTLEDFLNEHYTELWNIE